MKCLLFNSGSRGDTQPFIALARELQIAGHAPVLAGPASWKQLAGRYGVPYRSLEDTIKELFNDAEIGQITESKKRFPVRAVRTLTERYSQSRAAMLQQISTAADECADVIVHDRGIPAHHIAEKVGAPAVPVCFVPNPLLTKSLPHPIAPFRVPGLGYVPSHYLGRSVVKLMKLILPKLNSFEEQVSTWRQEVLNLPPVSEPLNCFRMPNGRHPTVLQACSQYAVSEKLSFPSWVHTTGYWYLPSPPDWDPPRALQDFIAAGEPPIYVGFGSLRGSEPERTTRIIAQALRIARVRAVVATGWGGIDVDALDGDDVFVVDEAPHDWLFPRMAAVVHHGGAGTTAASLAAGRPQVLCPFSFDQPFWARNMHAQGVAAAPQSQHSLDAVDLADAICRVVTDRTMAERASKLGEVIRSEHGAARAVAILESVT